MELGPGSPMGGELGNDIAVVAILGHVDIGGTRKVIVEFTLDIPLGLLQGGLGQALGHQGRGHHDPCLGQLAVGGIQTRLSLIGLLWIHCGGRGNLVIGLAEHC